MSSSGWIDTLLGPQDLIDELPEARAQSIRAYASNAGRSLAPGTMAYLPVAAPQPQGATAGSTNNYGANTQSVSVEIRLKALVSLPPDGAFPLKSQRAKPALDEPPDTFGFTFSAKRLGEASEETDPALQSWFSGPRSLKSGASLECGKMRARESKVFELFSKVTSDEYIGDEEAMVSAVLVSKNDFLEVRCLLLDVAQSQTVMAKKSDSLWDSVKLIGRTFNARRAPLFNFSPPRLVEVARFKRVFEITYSIRSVRGIAAWHSARIEIERGSKLYGAGTWETWGENRGALINEYSRYLISSYTQPGSSTAPEEYKDWVNWINDQAKTPKPADENSEKFHNYFKGKKGNEPWCGFFYGFHHKRAGFECRGKYVSSDPQKPLNIYRHNICDSTIKLYQYFKNEKRPRIEFVQAQFDHNNEPVPGLALVKGTTAPKTPEECAAWLRDNLNEWGPQPGDVILVSAPRAVNAEEVAKGKEAYMKDSFDTRRMNHFAMVSRYDPETFVLEAYEGNADDLAHAYKIDLSIPANFYKIYWIGRFSAADYRKGRGEFVTRVLKEGSPEASVGQESTKSV